MGRLWRTGVVGFRGCMAEDTISGSSCGARFERGELKKRRYYFTSLERVEREKKIFRVSSLLSRFAGLPYTLRSGSE